MSMFGMFCSSGCMFLFKKKIKWISRYASKHEREIYQSIIGFVLENVSIS
jgi:hypothetical protein